MLLPRFTFLCLLSLVSSASAATFYAHPTGSGTTCSTGAPCSMQQGLATIDDGDTLIAKCGAYTGATGMLDPADNHNGTSGSRITVSAEIDGCVLFNGQNARIPVRLYNNDYWILEGFNACCSNEIVMKIGTGADNNIIRRVIAWDSANFETSIWNVWGSTGNHLIDIAGWGQGRKAFGRIGDTSTVVLRGFFFKFKSLDTDPGDDVTYSAGYKSVSAMNLNIIVGTDFLPGSDTNSVFFLGSEHYTGVSGLTTTLRILGSIYYHVDGQNIGQASRGLRTSLNPGNVPAGNAITTMSRNNLTMRRNAAIPGIAHDCPTDGVKSICDQGDWTDSLGPPTAAGTHATENGNQAFGSFNNGLLQLGAASQPANGAWLRYSYTTAGTIDTGTPLWPWPMNTRIKNALISSGYSARGLDGKGATDLTALMMSLSGSELGGVGGPSISPLKRSPKRPSKMRLCRGFGPACLTPVM